MIPARDTMFLESMNQMKHQVASKGNMLIDLPQEEVDIEFEIHDD